MAVLDWELTTLGHPLSDLANMCGSYYMPASDASSAAPPPPAHLRGLMGLDLKQHGIPQEHELLRTYLAGCTLPLTVSLPGQQELRAPPAAPNVAAAAADTPTPQAPQAVPWSFFMAMYFFKYAVIAHGIAARAAAGNAASSSAHLAKRYVPLLASMCESKLELLEESSTSFSAKL